MAMSIITLLTDFGMEDAYVGIMKGVILRINPAATIVDISHSVAPQDIVQAAFMIPEYYPYFPEKTVHIIVVDPGVGGKRDIVALETNKQIFLAPDNGVMTPLIESGAAAGSVRVSNETYFLKPVSNTFHGRDIFAPVGAHLSKTQHLRDVGDTVEANSLVRLDLPRPYVTEEGAIAGAIVSIDRFGNLITNIDRQFIRNRFEPASAMHELKIAIGNRVIEGLSRSYDSALPAQPLAIIGSRGCVEISINSGSACKYFNSETGDRVKIIIP
jgi:S-adenosylmethionine hydrolase